ncbi:portal protein [Weizmannia phage Youna2]
MAKITMPTKPSIWKRIVGEISNLRNKFAGLTTGKYGSTYTLDSSKVDYTLTRGLYHNSLEKYKLGAGFAKPIIDTTVGFVGTPRWQSDDEGAQAVLDEHMERLRALLQKTNRNTFRDGDCFTRVYRKPIEEAVLYKSEKPQIDLQILPPQAVDPILDAETGQVKGYVVTTNVTYEQDGHQLSYDIIEEITATQIVKYYRGNDVPPQLRNITAENPQAETNKWGFVPIIHWKNDSEEDELFGRSDLEPLEPFLKAYHDVMMNSLKNNKMHAAPKLKLKINDVAAFLRHNFGVDVNNLKSGEKPKINFSGSDIIIMPHNDDEVEFIQATSTMNDSGTLLEFLFYCIVDVSETPEFAFGTALQSSKASVKEQMTPLAKKVERKREMLEENYKLLARMILCMYEKADIGLEKMTFATYDTKLDWDAVVERDMATESVAIVNYVNALNTAVTAGMMSLETAVGFLEKFIPNMMPFDGEEESEQTRIIRGFKFLEQVGKGPLHAMALQEAQLFKDDAEDEDPTKDDGDN